MNGFKVFAVGAFLYCGPTFCQAQITALDSQAGPKSILVKAVQEDAFQPTAESDLKRPSSAARAEVIENEIENPFAGASGSPSDLLIDAHQTPISTSNNDPASLPLVSAIATIQLTRF